MVTRASDNYYAKIVTQIDDSRDTAEYTLKINKNMDPRNQEWIEVFKTCDALAMAHAIDKLSIALIQTNKSVLIDYWYDEGWDAACKHMRFEMKDKENEV